MLMRVTAMGMKKLNVQLFMVILVIPKLWPRMKVPGILLLGADWFHHVQLLGLGWSRILALLTILQLLQLQSSAVPASGGSVTTSPAISQDQAEGK